MKTHENILVQKVRLKGGEGKQGVGHCCVEHFQGVDGVPGVCNHPWGEDVQTQSSHWTPLECPELCEKTCPASGCVKESMKQHLSRGRQEELSLTGEETPHSMEMTPFHALLLCSPPLSLPVFPVISSPWHNLSHLSCPPFSHPFHPSFSPFPCSPLSCPALSSCPLLPGPWFHSSAPAKVNKPRGCVHTGPAGSTPQTLLLSPRLTPGQRQHLSAHSWDRERPHFLTAKKKLSDSESRGEVLYVHVHLCHFTVKTPFPCPHCWIMNDAAPSSSHTVMGAWGKHEEHPPLCSWQSQKLPGMIHVSSPVPKAALQSTAVFTFLWGEAKWLNGPHLKPEL